jgi:ABC-type antimicrobial peptide transport system permease subunit
MIRHGIFREILGMAFDSLRTHKLRSFLTLLGIMIGVMTVIGMVSIVQGLNASFLKELEAAIQRMPSPRLTRPPSSAHSAVHVEFSSAAITLQSAGSRNSMP